MCGQSAHFRLNRVRDYVVCSHQEGVLGQCGLGDCVQLRVRFNITVCPDCYNATILCLHQSKPTETDILHLNSNCTGAPSIKLNLAALHYC